MTRLSPQSGTMTAAKRGQIVQRVLVDGWTIGDAAAAGGVPERLVAAWVADYRRHGMASLRRRPRRTVAAEIVQLRLLRPVRLVYRGVAIGMRWLFTWDRPTAPPLPIRRSKDDLRGGS
jgi:Helix-turn-helix domain